MSLLRGAIIGGANQFAAMRQQKDASDEQTIANKVKAFGPAYDAYSKGVTEFSKENEQIKTVAAMLEAQDPDFVKDLSVADLEDVAQSLILRSGKDKPGDVLDYFATHKDKLSVIKGAPKAPTTSADTQTAEMLQPSAPQPDNRSFIQKLFGGKTDNQIKEAVVNELGITSEKYDMIMAGKIPKMGMPDTMLRLKPDDKYETIIDEKQNNVLEAITKQNFIKMEGIKLPNGNTVTGKQLADRLMTEYENYKVNGGDGAKLSQMQNFALTLAMPPDLKSFFKEHHGKAIDAISAGISNPNIPETARNRLTEIDRDLTNHMMQALTVPGYATVNGGKNATMVQNLVIEGRKLLAQEVKDGKQPPQIELLDKSINELLTRANSTSPNAPQVKDSESVEEIYGLRQRFVEAQNAKDPVKALNELAVDVQRLSSTAFKAPEAKDKPGKSDVFFDMFKSLDFFANMPDDEIKKRADEFAALGGKVSTDKSGKSYITITHGGVLANIPVGTMTSAGRVTDLTLDQVKDFTDKIKANSSSLNVYAGLTSTVMENPLVYTILGKLSVRGATYADIGGELTGTNIGQQYARYFNVQENAEAQRQAIELVGSAKDRLFDDPRLSDQDLRLVLQYIAILDNEKFLGTGSTQAIAALQGLQTAILKDTASRMYDMKQHTRTLPSPTTAAGEIDYYDESGKFVDDSLASALFKQMSSAYKFKVKSLSDVEDLPADEQQLYLAKHDMITKMVENALHDIVTYDALGIDKATAPSSLPSMGTVRDDDTFMVNGVEYTTEKLEDLVTRRGV